MPCDFPSVALEMWDTSVEVFASSESSCSLIFRSTDVYILCFALDRLESYHDIRSKWYPEVQRRASNVPIILVGTKCEVRDAHTGIVDDLVTTDMGEKLREEIKAFAYVECSSRKSLHLEAVFEEAVRSALSASSPSLAPRDDGPEIGGAQGMPSPCFYVLIYMSMSGVAIFSVLRSWLETYLDVHLFDEAIRFRAQKKDLISRMDTAKYLDRWRADGAAGI